MRERGTLISWIDPKYPEYDINGESFELYVPREKLPADFVRDIESYRTYTPGDDLRHLDWNAYGRLDQLCTSRTVPITPALIHAASVYRSGSLLYASR